MRTAAALRLSVLSLVLGATPLSVAGQEPAPAAIGAEAVLTRRDEIQLTLPWRFHAGDDPAWADPHFDDGTWDTVEPAAPVPPALPGQRAQVVWLRRHLRLDRRLWGVPLALSVQSRGRVTVYVDGTALASFEPLPRSVQGDAQATKRGPTFFTLPGGADHVLAVRYQGPVGAGDDGDGASHRFFLITLEGPDAALGPGAVSVRRGQALYIALSAIPLFLAFLHLAFYGFLPSSRENLFYACLMAAFAAVMIGNASGLGLLPGRVAEEIGRLTPAAVFVVILFGLLTYYALHHGRFPRTWITFTIAAVLLAVASYVFPGSSWGWIWYVFFAATVVEIVRVERSRRTPAREGAGVLLWGFLLLAVFITLQVLVNLDILPPLPGFPALYVLGMLAFAISMSLFLARTFAHTSLHLEQRLAEVQALSGQVLEGERLAHEQELRQRLLEAENERKGHELDAARDLQLSMLPSSLPVVDGLELGVAMATATEVGGDYYDFRGDGYGGLLLAIGDATGHGAAAGTMVTAVKALFATLPFAAGLAPAMHEYDRVLRSLGLKRMHMCLTVANVAPRRVRLCSAAMPPLLIHRATSGEVEELGRGELPLGGNLSPPYTEQDADLCAGDTLLFATDGLAELLDPAGRVFGQERTAAVLREAAAGSSAREVVDRLTRAASDWRGPREQLDDITVVVVRVVRRGRNQQAPPG